MALDDETRAALQALVGGEHALPPPVHSRINGDTVAAMRTDAAVLAEELGIAPAREKVRDGRGRFVGSDMNARIRAAAGRA